MERIPSLWKRQSGSDSDGDTSDPERLATDATGTSTSADTSADISDRPTHISDDSDDESQDSDDKIGKGKVGDNSDGHEIVRFNVSTNFKPSEDNPTGRVYNINEKEVTLGWEPKNDDVHLDGVRFWAFNPELDRFDPKDATPSVAIKEFLFNTDKDGWGDEYNDANAPLTHVFRGGGTLNYSLFRDDEVYEGFRAHQMAIEVLWQSDDRSGYSRSGFFTFADLEEDKKAVRDFSNIIKDGGDVANYGAEEFTNGRPPSKSADPTSSSAAPSSTGTKDTGNDDGGDSGGLSTAAMAGIAVAGGVVLLTLIAALVWYLLRRRSRQKRESRGKKLTDSTTFMGTKEISHDDSPHSTFSSDQHMPLSNLHSHQERTSAGFAPYHDDAGAASVPIGTAVSDFPPAPPPKSTPNQRPSPPPQPTARQAAPAPAPSAAAASSPGGSPTAGRSSESRSSGRGSTPYDVHPSVANLVEEGMTEEEVRRLEEEERQIEAALERHRAQS